MEPGQTAVVSWPVRSRAVAPHRQTQGYEQNDDNWHCRFGWNAHFRCEPNSGRGHGDSANQRHEANDQRIATHGRSQYENTGWRPSKLRQCRAGLMLPSLRRPTPRHGPRKTPDRSPRKVQKTLGCITALVTVLAVTLPPLQSRLPSLLWIALVVLCLGAWALVIADLGPRRRSRADTPAPHADAESLSSTD